jgi:hypothetical protein
MDNHPLKRKSRTLPILISIALACAVIGTPLLLANDKRHLRSLLDYFHIDWLHPKPVVEATPETKTDRPQAAQRPPVPARLVLPVLNDLPSAFVREFRINGQTLCEVFAQSGFVIAEGGWQASPFDINTYECLAEEMHAATDGSNDFASFFLDIKGAADGRITSLRMKIASPATDDGKRMREQLDKALTLAAGQLRWTDLPQTLAAEDYDTNHFGMRVSIKREFNNQDRYNILIVPTDRTAELKRTRNFFDTAQWLAAATPEKDMPFRHQPAHKAAPG